MINHKIPIYIVSIPIRKESRLEPLVAKIKSNDRYYIKEVYGVVGKNVIEGFLNKGQIGCFMSHYGIWKKIIKQTEPYALILEDDAIISLPEMLKLIEYTLRNLPSNWDVCYLGGRYQDENSVYKVNKNIVRSDSSVIWHAHAYLIRQHAASQLVLQSKNIFEEKKHIDDFANIAPLDDWMTHPDRRLNVYKTDPNIIEFKFDEISDTTR